MVKHVFPNHTILKHLSYSNFNYSFRFMMSANFSPVIQEVQISFLWRQEKMLQSCLRPTIPSVKLPPSKLFRILLRKLPTLEARFPLLPLPRPLIPQGGGGWVRTYFLEYRLLIKPIYTIFFDNAEKVRIHTFSSFWIVYTETFNRGISGDMLSFYRFSYVYFL